MKILACVHAEDPISRAGLETALCSRPEIGLVDMDAAAPPPRVAVIAVRTLDETALQIMRRLHAQGRTRSVVVVSDLSEAGLLAAVEAGACAVIWRREATQARLTHAVAKAAAGEATLPSSMLSKLLRQLSRRQRPVLGGLSVREADVLQLAADGFGTDEIAQKLCYSNRTVANIVHDVTTRFNLNNRTHAVAYAIRTGLI
jgi:DNA-binding NarL/FixJ family response regulator